MKVKMIHLSKRNCSVFIKICLLLTVIPFTNLNAQNSKNIRLIGRWAGGPSYTVASQGSTIYFGDGAYLRIREKDPTGGYLKGKIALPSIVRDVAVSGNYAYVADDKAGLRVVDVSDPQHPVEVGSYSITYPYIATGITVIGHDVYLANFYNSNTIATAITTIIDISNPSKPVYVKKENFYGKNSVVSGNIMAVVSGAGGSPQEVDFVDISNPGNPKSLGYFMPVFYDVYGVANGVAIKGHTAYIAYGSGTTLQGQGKTVGLWVVDITNPLSPKQITSYPTSSNAMNVTVAGHYAFVGTYSNGLKIIDISDSTHPTEVGSYFLNHKKATNSFYPQKFISVHDTGYVAYSTDGLRLIDYSNPASVITIDSIPTAASGNSLTIAGNYAYLSDDGDGLQIINMKDPSNPVRAGFFSPTTTLPNRSFDVAVHNNYAYLAASYAGTGSPGGLKMIDISDRTHPTQIGSFSEKNIFSVDRVFTKGNYTFLIQTEAYSDDKNGLVVLNTSDPSNPVKVNFIHNDWASNLIHKGNYAYLFADSLYVIDISNPTNIKVVGSLSGVGATAVSANVTIYGNYLYIIYTGGLLVTIDISDPSNPKRIGDIYLNLMSQYSYESVAVDSQFIYLSSDTALMIFNKSNLSASSKAVGYYSTGDYATAIKVHEDTIFVTDNNDGLYILHNDLHAMPDQPPVVSQKIPDLTYREDTGPKILTSDLYSNFNDPDGGNDLTFSASFVNGDKNISLNVQKTNGKYQLSANSTLNDFGSARFYVTAQDTGKLSVNDTVNVTVTPVNDPPTINLPDSITIMEDESFSFALLDSTKDIDTPDSLLTFHLSYSNSYTSFYAQILSDTLTGSAGSSGRYWLTVTVTDDSSASAQDSMLVIVKKNNLPILTLPDTLKVTTDQNFNIPLRDYASDVETPDTLLNFSFSYTKSNSFYVSMDTATATIYGSGSTVGEYYIYVTVTDQNGGDAKDTTVISVRNTTGVNDIVNKNPKTYYLSQNYPNPLNSGTEISFGMPGSGFVTLKIYDMSGREVAMPINKFEKAGAHKIKFDASKLVEGVYFYRLSIKSGARNFVEMKKMILKK